MNSSFNANHARALQQQKQQQLRHHNEAVAHAHEAAQHGAQAEKGAPTHGQGRYGDTVFRTLPRPPAPPPRQNRLPGQRSDGKEVERSPEGPGAEPAEHRAAGNDKGPVEAVDRDSGRGQQHQHHDDSHDNDQAGGFGGGHGGAQSGGHSGGGHSGGGQSGNQSGNQSGGGQSGGGQQPATRFAVPAARGSALGHLPTAGLLAPEVAAFRDALASTALPQQRARHLAAALVSLSKPGRGHLHADAMMMSLMAAYIESTNEPGALSTLARVKQVLVEAGPVLTGLLPPGPRERNRLALLPLKLLVCDRQRTEAQRLIAAERLHAGQRWPAEVIEHTP